VRQNRLNVTVPAQACLYMYEVCFQIEMLRNAAEIVGRFCAKLNAFHCANVYTRKPYHGNINTMKEIVQMVNYCLG